MKVLESYQLKSMTIKNRLVMPPMCMYSSDETGTLAPTGSFHKEPVH